MKTELKGVWTAIVTPFRRGELDWDSLRKLVRMQIDGGVQGLVICGTTGESPTLNEQEKKQVFQFVSSEVSGAVPLMMGTGTNSTSETIRMTQLAKEWGASSALVVVPYYNKPTQRGLLMHFEAVANEGGLPVVLYNVPSRTITQLDPETVIELAKHPGIVGIKEASGQLPYTEKVFKATKMQILSGDDGTCFPLVGVGAVGVISVISNVIPREMSQWMREALELSANPSADQKAKALEVAAKFDSRFAGLNSSLYFEANPIPVKWALWKMGVIGSPELRLPLTSLNEKYQQDLEKELKKAQIL